MSDKKLDFKDKKEYSDCVKTLKANEIPGFIRELTKKIKETKNKNIYYHSETIGVENE